MTTYRRRPLEVQAVRFGCDWIVTEHGETRVVPDAEFQRDYEASVSFCGGIPVIEYATEKLDWSDDER